MASISNGSLAASAIAHLCQGGETVPLSRGGQDDLLNQFALLIEWARGCDRLHNYEPPPNSEQSGGTEHHVYFHESVGRVFKKTKDEKFGSIRTSIGVRRTATPYFYLRRLEWCNEVFASDLQLEWIVPNSKAIVISQPLAEAEDDNAPLPTQKEICAFMERMGFRSVNGNNEEWYRDNDQCSACDAKCENFIRTAMGIRPIDLIVSKELGFNPHELNK